MVSVKRIKYVAIILIALHVSANHHEIEALQLELTQASLTEDRKVTLLMSLAELHLYRKPELTQAYAFQALPLSINDQAVHIRAHQLLGMANMYQGRDSEASNYLQQAIALANTIPSDFLL